MKRRYRYRETKSKKRCLLCTRRMVWNNDADTERRRGRGREGAFFVFVEWSKDTIRIQRDEEEEKVSALYPQDSFKRWHGYREMKRTLRCIPCIRRMDWNDDADTERRRGRESAYFYPVEWWRDDTNTERRRGSGREGAYLLSVYWSKETIRIQRDDEDDTMPTLYSYNDLKRRHRYRETKMKMRCLLCMRGMVLRNDTDTERRRWRRDVCFVCVEWS